MGYIGSIENLYKNIGIIDNIEKASKSLEFYSKVNGEEVDIDLLNKCAEDGALYFNNEYVPLEVTDVSYTEEYASHKVVPTYLVDVDNKSQICVAFYKDTSGVWVGAYFGPLKRLLNTLQSKQPSVSNKARKRLSQLNTNIILYGKRTAEINSNQSRFKTMQDYRQYLNITNEVSISYEGNTIAQNVSNVKEIEIIKNNMKSEPEHTRNCRYNHTSDYIVRQHF